MLDADLKEILVQQGNTRVFFDNISPPHQARVLNVALDGQPVSFDERHVILLHSGFPPSKARAEIYCLFPNTRNPRSRILATHSYWRISSMNIDMNKALCDSTDAGTSRFALAYGSNVVSFSGLRGTLYLVWAKTMTLYNASETVVQIDHDCPLLINMNGELIMTAIFNLKTNALLPIVQRDAVRTPVLMGNHAHLWVYEKRPERFAVSRNIRVMSEYDATLFAERPSRNTREWIWRNDTSTATGFQDDDDDDDDDGNAVMEPSWTATPAGVVFIHGMRVEAVSSTHEDEEPRDPFSDSD
jgi:hypothetical protein